MLQFELLLCAENFIKDSENDSFSAINIFEDYIAEGYPVTLNKASVFLKSTKEEDDKNAFEVRFQIYNNDFILFDNSYTINFIDSKKANTRLNINNLLVPNPGKLTFKFVDTEHEIAYSINMKQREVPTVNQ